MSLYDLNFNNTESAVPALPKTLQFLMLNPARVAVIIFVFLMLYQAALPSGLSLQPAARTITWDILPSDSFHLSKADVIGNVVPYFIFGVFVFLASWRRRPEPKRVVWVTFSGTIAMACAVEFVQFFNMDRGSAVWDILSGVIGGVLSLITGAIYAPIYSAKWKILLYIISSP